VTSLIIAPYKYSYLLTYTYQVSCVHLKRLQCYQCCANEILLNKQLSKHTWSLVGRFAFTGTSTTTRLYQQSLLMVVHITTGTSTTTRLYQQSLLMVVHITTGFCTAAHPGIKQRGGRMVRAYNRGLGLGEITHLAHCYLSGFITTLAQQVKNCIVEVDCRAVKGGGGACYTPS